MVDRIIGILFLMCVRCSGTNKCDAFDTDWFDKLVIKADNIYYGTAKVQNSTRTLFEILCVYKGDRSVNTMNIPYFGKII